MACMVGMPVGTTGKACTHDSASVHLRPGVERATDGLCRERGFFCCDRGWWISCRDMVHCVLTWVGCSGWLGQDMNLEVATRPQAVRVILVATQILMSQQRYFTVGLSWVAT